MTWPAASDLEEFTEAVEWFRNLLPLTDEQFEQLSTDAQRRAFRVAGVAQLDIVSQVFNALLGAIANGTKFEDFKRDVVPALEKAWGESDPHRVETIFRNNVQRAYNRGRWKQMRDPEVAAVRPYLMYDAIVDDRTTDICRQLHGTVLPAEDSFWSTRLPPLHHRCRSSLRSLTTKQAERRGITEERPIVEADQGFGDSPDIESDWQPDAGNYPPELWRIYERKQAEAG